MATNQTSSHDASSPTAGGSTSRETAARADRHKLRDGLTIVAAGLLIFVLLFYILREFAEILRPLFIAVFLCYLIVPAHRWLANRGVPSWLAYVVIVGTVLVSMYGVGSMAYVSIRDLSEELPAYIDRLETVSRDTLDKLNRQLGLAKEAAGNGAPADADHSAATGPGAGPTDMSSSDVEDRHGARPQQHADDDKNEFSLFSSQKLVALIEQLLQGFLGFLTGALVVVFYLFFLLAEAAGFQRRLKRAFGTERAEHIQSVVHSINVAVAKYIAAKGFISLLVALLTLVVLVAFGVRYAWMWSILTFFANFIPYVGSLVAVLLPIAMSVVQFDTWWQPITIAVLLTVAQQLTGSVMEPRLFGRELGVSPLLILLSLAFWGWIWGVPGMILSAPLIVIAKIILENMEPTRPIAKLMSNV